MTWALFALCCCTGEHWTVVHNDAAHRSIVVFGDSLALGVGASSSDNGFVQLLVDRMRRDDPDATVANFAVGGATVNDVAQQQTARAAGLSATDVWLCVGGNDVTHATPTDQFSASEQALAAQLRAMWPAAHIIIFGVPDVSRSPDFPGVVKIRLHGDAGVDNGAAEDAARASQADFVDLYSFSDTDLDVSADFSADAFHPNDRGYAAIADFAAARLR